MISRLNFDVTDTHNFKTLGLVDTSMYNPLLKIEDAKIEILPPGYAQAVSPFWMPKALNIFNSNSLGITNAQCEEELADLPDGIYRVKYSVCPNDKLFIEKFFLRTDKIRCKYTQAFLTLDLSNLEEASEKAKRKALEEVEFYIEGANAAANNKDAKLASDFYKKADRLLSKYLANKDVCGC